MNLTCSMVIEKEGVVNRGRRFVVNAVMLGLVSFIGTMAARWYFTPLVLIPWAGFALILMKVAGERMERMDI